MNKKSLLDHFRQYGNSPELDYSQFNLRFCDGYSQMNAFMYAAQVYGHNDFALTQKQWQLLIDGCDHTQKDWDRTTLMYALTYSGKIDLNAENWHKLIGVSKLDSQNEDGLTALSFLLRLKSEHPEYVKNIQPETMDYAIYNSNLFLQANIIKPVCPFNILLKEKNILSEKQWNYTQNILNSLSNEHKEQVLSNILLNEEYFSKSWTLFWDNTANKEELISFLQERNIENKYSPLISSTEITSFQEKKVLNNLIQSSHNSVTSNAHTYKL